MKNALVKKSNVTDVATQNVEILEVNTDARVYSRMGWAIVIIGVLGFLIWAFTAPLDKGVPMSGNVAVASSRKVIQHQTGGTVDEILVKDGDVVKAGQTLLKMNSVSAKAAAEVTRVQLFTAKAVEARLLAERDGAKSINFPKELNDAKTDVRVANSVLLQQQLFSSRQISFQSEIGAIDENIAGLKSQLKGLEDSMVSKKQQQQFLKEQLDGLRDLAKDGYIARNRLLDQERTYAQVNGSISEDLGNMGRVSRQVMELSLRKSQRLQDYQKEIRTQLTDIQKEAEALQNRMTALDFDLNNIAVKAPVDGTVVALNVFTKGAVVPGGFKLMELVPQDDALIVEASLPVNLVDKVHAGLKTELIFSAFNTNTTPHIPGVITQVSADRTVDERTGQAFYKVRAEVAPEGKKMIANLNIRPGMPVEMFVSTGGRTMMNYLLKPVIDRAHSAMTED
ncbi:HlyD family type I secretion periplasmic adaptor subunit [Undibacterium sp. TS12]|uniref:HlyD family type I secretion periplasmic adaptor subunit n=1 Tax=Undibacterium sp. TS12 TaxID=2908202 RepID=UPI001F4D3000|nr:HlyD family type I secretion periplasmic adaptor subunit [Undibacterium sp. TS12]MCH8621109.1 HlyD family type I secretion periplasmic adaptor subunit [Undibacterium sp. TS12]